MSASEKFIGRKSRNKEKDRKSKDEKKKRSSRKKECHTARKQVSGGEKRHVTSKNHIYIKT